MAWTGVKHPTLYAQIVDLACNVGKAQAVVVDATGVGAEFYAFLQDTYADPNELDAEVIANRAKAVAHRFSERY